MSLNTHYYPYNIGDIVWVITSLNIRSGKCVQADTFDGPDTEYHLLMDDTAQVEVFKFSEIFPLKSYAEIYKQQALITPTPSVSHSISPTPTRTPKPSQTITPTPSHTPLFYQNIFSNDENSWDANNGTVTFDEDGSITFESTSTNNAPVIFQTTAPVDENSNYEFHLRYIAQTCKRVKIEIFGTQSTEALATYTINPADLKTFSDLDLDHSGDIKTVVAIPSGVDNVSVAVTLYESLHPTLFALNGYTYKFGVLSMVKLAYQQNITPTPSVTHSLTMPTPTPSVTPTPSPVVQQVFNRFTRLTSMGLPDQTFQNLGLIGPSSINTIFQASDDNIYIGGQYHKAVGGPNYTLGRLDSSGNVDTNYQWEMNSTGINDIVYKIIQTSDGKMYVGGKFTQFMGSQYTALARLESDGTLDNTFTSLQISGSSVSVSDILQSVDGKFYLALQIDSDRWIYRLNSDGTLDNSFEQIKLNWNGSSNNPYYFCQTSDGKIYVVGGNATIGVAQTQYYGIMRLNSDGTFDTDYVNPITGDNVFNGILQAEDGKIYVFGTVTPALDGHYSTGIVRLNSDGSLDTLDSSTINVLQYGSIVKTMIQAEDGYIYFGGTQYFIDNEVKWFGRLNSDGTFDSSFIGPTLYDSVSKIYQTRDGKIYIAGGDFSQSSNLNLKIIDASGNVTSTINTGNLSGLTVLNKTSSGDILFTSSLAFPFNNFGILDSSGNVKSTFAISALNGSALYAIEDNSKYLLCGAFSSINGENYISLARVNSDGSVDTTFNKLNITRAESPEYPADVYKILKAADGRIYFVGDFDTINDQGMYYIARFNTDGTLDTSYSLSLSPGIYGGTIYDIVQTADGKIYIAGDIISPSGVYKKLLRLNSDGTLDETFTDLALDGSAVNAIYQTSNGKIYISGDFTTVGGNTYNGTARLNSDGTVDTSFVDLLLDGNSCITDFVELSSGKLMVIGLFFIAQAGSPLLNYICLARLNADGSVDTSFAPIVNQTYMTADGIVLLDNDSVMVSGLFTEQEAQPK